MGGICNHQLTFAEDDTTMGLMSEAADARRRMVWFSFHMSWGGGAAGASQRWPGPRTARFRGHAEASRSAGAIDGTCGVRGGTGGDACDGGAGFGLRLCDGTAGEAGRQNERHPHLRREAAAGGERLRT